MCRCNGTGVIVYGSDTETGRYETSCDCSSDLGMLVIHRDLPGTHWDGVGCWCSPNVYFTDTLKTPVQIVKECSVEGLE